MITYSKTTTTFSEIDNLQRIPLHIVKPLILGEEHFVHLGLFLQVINTRDMHKKMPLMA